MGRLLKLQGSPFLGLAAIVLDGGLRQEFDQLLRTGLAREPGLARSAEPLLRRRTGKEGPFVWHQDRWLPEAERDLLVKSEEAGREVQKLLGIKEHAERSRALQEFSGRGEMERAAARSVLNERLAALTASLQGQAFFKQLERVAALRAELDQRRTHALDLIFDEQAYFHPFRPPECPPEKAKLYWPVQQEVDRRIAAVQLVWNRKVTLQIPATLLALAREARWTLKALADQGGWDPGQEEVLQDVLRLPLQDRKSVV